jgi:sodium-dependent dicarboxylate transporter 2/3/5
MRAAASPYAHELIFLFMGGFMLALSMQRWGLHRRIALLALLAAGDRPAHIVAAFMAVAAGLSMWVSNTATAVMMLPVAQSVIDLLETRPSGAPESERRGFPLALLLGIAYGASIGGVATPIGTPPNLFVLSFIDENLGREIPFVQWLGIGLPLVAVLLPATWLLLTRVLFALPSEPVEGGRALFRRELAALGPLDRGEVITLVVFVLACALWVTRPLLVELELLGARPFAGLRDAGIAMLAAVVLFVAPADRDRAVLDWDTARQLPWGILILFGGGLSLAAAISSNGVASFLGAQAGGLAGLPPLGIVLGVVAAMVFLTELTSNTASTAALVPLLAALAPGLGIDPLLLAIPAAIAASCAFMLPVATPPNAVVFGSGRIAVREMARAGLWLNAIAIVAITALAFSVVVPLLALR